MSHRSPRIARCSGGNRVVHHGHDTPMSAHSDRASEGYGRWLEIFVPGRICLMGESTALARIGAHPTRHPAHAHAHATPSFGHR